MVDLGSAPDLGGIFVASATPFDPVTGDLDLVGLRTNLRSWLGTAVRGVLIGGSTGEAALLDSDERIAALRASREVLPSDRLIIAGTGAESTRQTLRRTHAAAAAGADVVLVQPPSYYKGAMTVEALADHYHRVADASPLPVLLYQPPLRFSTVELPTALVIELSEHPNVVGFKDSRGDMDILSEVLSGAPPGFQLLTGAAGRLGDALERGAAGAILAIGNFAPGAACALYGAAVEGRGAEVGRIQAQLAPLGEEIVARHGIPGVKTALDLLGLRGGPPRSPLQPLDEAGTRAVREALAAAMLLDTPRGSG